jgi:hypothetical protein
VRSVETGSARVIRAAESAIRDPSAVVDAVDQYIWNEVPSGVGTYFDATAGWNLIHGEQASVQGALVFNWRSGELSYTGSYGGAEEIATPKLLGADVSSGILLLKGYSSNDALFGPSKDYGFGLQADAFAKMGLDAGLSLEMNQDPVTGKLKPAYDDTSNLQPLMINIGGSLGLNVVPSGIEASVSWGASNTPVMATVQLYPWNWGER